MDIDARRRAYVNRPATGNGPAVRLLLAGDDLHACRRAPPRVATPGWAWFVAELTPPQQDAYVERLFDDESWTVQPVVKETDVVALLEAHLRWRRGHQQPDRRHKRMRPVRGDGGLPGRGVRPGAGRRRVERVAPPASVRLITPLGWSAEGDAALPSAPGRAERSPTMSAS